MLLGGLWSVTRTIFWGELPEGRTSTYFVLGNHRDGLKSGMVFRGFIGGGFRGIAKESQPKRGQGFFLVDSPSVKKSEDLFSRRRYSQIVVGSNFRMGRLMYSSGERIWYSQAVVQVSKRRGEPPFWRSVWRS